MHNIQVDPQPVRHVPVRKGIVWEESSKVKQGVALMKRTRCWILMLTIVFAVSGIASSADATELTSYVCPEGEISVGDSPSDFLSRCMAASQSVSTSDNPNALWVHLDPAARQVVYFQFADNRLERIYSRPCLTTTDSQQDPYCAELQTIPSD